jgi:hypothetical protein
MGERNSRRGAQTLRSPGVGSRAVPARMRPEAGWKPYQTMRHFGAVSREVVMAGKGDERSVDPGDAVPEGVAPKDPPPPSDDDLRVKRKLERLGKVGEDQTGRKAPDRRRR